ncbi:hypothetical protein KR009_009039, partial [Drosophila setifemur]
IGDVLIENGMRDIDAVQLDRKFRNLKKTYYSVRSKKQSMGDTYHPNWQFYGQMAAILKNEEILATDDYVILRNNEADAVVSDASPGRCPPTDSKHEVRPVRKRRTLDDGQARRRNVKRELDPGDDVIKVINAADPCPSNSCDRSDEISISTAEEAMRHLRALQEYAMFQDNFRAIGLLLQAEHAIECPPNSKDFEV